MIEATTSFPSPNLILHNQLIPMIAFNYDSTVFLHHLPLSDVEDDLATALSWLEYSSDVPCLNSVAWMATTNAQEHLSTWHSTGARWAHRAIKQG